MTSQNPDPLNPFGPPVPTTGQAYAVDFVDPAREGDATGGLIPYKNPKALIAYYLGIFSMLPLLGLPLGIAALVLGFLGIRDYKRSPIIKGVVHAWIGIGCSLFGMLFHFLILAGIVVALVA